MGSISNSSQQSITRTDSQTLSASNTTATVPIFRISGTVHILMLGGIVTTALGSNVTAAYWRLNDQTVQTNITNSTGTTLSSAAAGSHILKVTNNGSAMTLLNTSAGRLHETAANHMTYQEFVLDGKNGANTDIEFVYTTTNTPTSGVIQFIVKYIPISSGATITPL